MLDKDLLSEEEWDYIESLAACGCDYSTEDEYNRAKLQQKLDEMYEAELGILEP